MTARERRIAELPAKDLESWARELPIGSETRRDRQQTARAYRFAARVGTRAVDLRVVPEADPREADGSYTAVASNPSAEQKSGEAYPPEAPRELHPPLGRGA